MSEVIFKKNYPNGNVTYDKQTGNAVFTPHNVTSDTPVYIYYTGDIGNSNYYPGYLAAPEAIANKYFENPNFNGIVVINNYENDSVYSDGYVNNSVKDNRRIVDDIEKQYGVNLNNRSVFGSSIGDRFALHDFVSQVRNGTDSGFCIITGASKINVKQGFNYTNLINSGTEDPNRAFLSEEDYNELKGKTVFAFESGNGHNYTYVNALADHDVNVFLVECADGGHNNLTLKPLQDNVFAFLAGDEDAIDRFIKNGNYHFKKCTDAKNNKWENATNEEIKVALISSVLSSDYTLRNNLGALTSKANNLKNSLNSKLDNPIIKSDDDYVGSSINNILSIINSTNLLSQTTSISFESTTKVPPSEIDLLHDYGNGIINLLDKISQECSAAEAISIHLDDTDWLLKHEAEMAFNMKDEPAATGGNNTSTYNGNSNTGGGSNNAKRSQETTPASNQKASNNNTKGNNKKTTNNNKSNNQNTNNTSKNSVVKDEKFSPETTEEKEAPKEEVKDIPKETEIKEIQEQRIMPTATTRNEQVVAPQEMKDVKPGESLDPINTKERLEELNLLDSLEELDKTNKDSLNKPKVSNISLEKEVAKATPEIQSNESNEANKGRNRDIGLLLGAAVGAGGYGIYKGSEKYKEKKEKEKESDEESNNE